ncbi:hypothetical protein CEXT_762241 [Caerostris extrusa]|uniref:Uncharacterized protein n=1 Tax=Caerostris extrusa TaxID=172846 RepID=A0AAV4M481_CAEEX|nr:hypothetical protein CEXT_762241 [Caerostris extrusa]
MGHVNERFNISSQSRITACCDYGPSFRDITAHVCLRFHVCHENMESIIQEGPTKCRIISQWPWLLKFQWTEMFKRQQLSATIDHLANGCQETDKPHDV